MDAYVFVARKGNDTFDRIKALGQPGPDVADVRYAARLDSDTDGFTHICFVKGDNDQQLQGRLHRLQAAINPPPTDTALATSYGPKAPSNWSPKPRYAAYVRIKAKTGLPASDVLHAMDTFPQYWGSAVVTGSYDVLLELAANDDADLDAALTGLGNIDGIASWSHAKALNTEHPEDWLK